MADEITPEENFLNHFSYFLDLNLYIKNLLYMLRTN